MTNVKRGDRPASNVAPARALRSDAAANRAHLLEVAADAFDHDGLAVSLDEIARRAGLGPGTLHRHFPTKASLIDATLAARVAALADDARTLVGDDDAAEAFLKLLALLVDRGAASHALADRLRRESGDIDAAVAEPLADLRATTARLLRRAQRAGGIRRDLTAGDVDAIVAAAHALTIHPTGGHHLVALLLESLRSGG